MSLFPLAALELSVFHHRIGVGEKFALNRFSYSSYVFIANILLSRASYNEFFHPSKDGPSAIAAKFSPQYPTGSIKRKEGDLTSV